MARLQFDDLHRKLPEVLKGDLPGKQAQFQMAPLGRAQTEIEELDHSKVKKAAVLALFVNEANNPNLVLTLRTDYGGVHANQISLPGGQREPQDRNYKNTALRETEEEVGLASREINVVGKLSQLYIPPSNFLVHPYVGILNNKPEFQREHSEVQEIFTVDFNRILASDSLQEQEVEARGYKIKVPVFKVDNYIIWGATAMMLSELRQILLK